MTVRTRHVSIQKEQTARSVQSPYGVIPKHVCCAEFMHHPPVKRLQFTHVFCKMLEECNAGPFTLHAEKVPRRCQNLPDTMLIEGECRGTYIACNVAGHSTEAHAQTRQGHGIPKSILIHELLVEHNQGRRYGHVHKAGHHCSNLLCYRMQIPAIQNQLYASGQSMHVGCCCSRQTLKSW